MTNLEAFNLALRLAAAVNAKREDPVSAEAISIVSEWRRTFFIQSPAPAPFKRSGQLTEWEAFSRVLELAGVVADKLHAAGRPESIDASEAINVLDAWRHDTTHLLATKGEAKEAEPKPKRRRL